MMPFDIHPASPEERLAAYRNVHDVWSGGLPLEEHVQRRLQSVRHNRAAWFVGSVGGRVVSSLACYPLQFHYRGQRMPGMALGSVHTLAEYRGRGLAPRLVAWVEEHQRQQGNVLSLLYSDIGVQYYARLGYIACPAWHITASSEAIAAAPSLGDAGRLVRCSASREVVELAAMYSAYHGRFPVAIDRTADYWEFLLRLRPEDEFFWLMDAGGERLGYVRMGSVAIPVATTKVWDYALCRHDDRLLELLGLAVVDLARQRGWGRLAGWWPGGPLRRSWLPLEPRQQEITMLKPLDGTVILGPADLEATDRFCEIDHV
jgi:predicted N-acetyltransferase YhbS